MQWFRNLIGGKAARPAPARPSVRPQLEALEERQLLNASTVFDSAGNKTTFVVFQAAAGGPLAGGNLYQYDKSGGKLIATGVRLAHGYRDANGNVGVDIVYANGNAYEFDSTGARTLSTAGNILDWSQARDANGNIRLEVLFNDGKGQGTGNLFEYTNKGASQIGTNILFASAYVDSTGALGVVVSYFDAGHSAVQVFAYDAVGPRALFNGNKNIGDPITDYDQTLDPTGKVVIDETLNFYFLAPAGTAFPGGNGSAQEFTATGVTSFGQSNIEPF